MKSMFCRFSSGIFAKNLSPTNASIEGRVFTNLLSLLQDPGTNDTCIHIDDTNLELCHCAFEADYKPMTEKIIQYIYPFIPTPHNAHDCAAVLYLLENVGNHDNLDLEFIETCANGKLIAKLAEVLANKHESLKVMQLHLSGGLLTDNDIFHLFNKAIICFRSLQSLRLNNNKITTTTFMASPQVMRCLRHLNLSQNPLGANGIQGLENAITTGSLLSLRHLSIQRTLTSDQDINGALLFTLCDALSSHCPQLTYFDASHNNLGTPGAQAIGSNLNQFNKQEKGFTLVLSNTELYDEGISIFASHLIYPCCLVVSSNSIGGDGAAQLMERISASYQYNFYSFWKLDLSENPINFEQVFSLIAASSCNFGSLLLCKCWLTKYPMRNQPHLAPQVNLIQFLQLDQNQFYDENINILLKIMASCHNLEILSCRQCGITSKDFRYLLSQLSNLETIIDNQLCQWWLNDNEIDDSGVAILIEFLSLFPNIHSLCVDGNPVSAEMKERLFGAVAAHRHRNGADVLFRTEEEEEADVPPLSQEAFQTQWEVIVSYLCQLAMEYSWPTWEIEPENKIEVQKCPEKHHSGEAQITELANFSDEESYEIASEGEDGGSCTCPPPSVLPSSINHDHTETKQSVESYQGLEILTISDLAKVQGKIWEARTKWYHLGLLLGVPVHTLDAIQYNHPTDCDWCFTDMIKEWLRASDLQRTWEALAEALDSPQVGQSDLAKQIRC